MTILLIANTTALNNASATANTQISLEDLTSFAVTQGETIVFSGRLIKSSTQERSDVVQGISDVTVNIVHKIAFDSRNILARGQTDADGYFSIPWIVNVENSIGQTGGSFGIENTQGRDSRFQMKVFAQFLGNDEFVQSTSNTQSFEVRLNALRLEVQRASYLAFESATVNIVVKDIDNNRVDPDRITSRFDNNPVTLLKQNTGTYVFSVASLSPGNHQLHLTAEKTGHTSDVLFITLEAMKRRTSLDIAMDKPSYQLGETATITASLVDETNELIRDRTVTGALISPNLDVKELTFVDGEASYTLTTKDVPGTWTVSASFPGDSSYFATTAHSAFIVTDKSVAVPSARANEKVALSNPVFLDHIGNRLDDVTLNQHITIQAGVTSNLETTEDITYISQVKNSNGITVSLSWITATITPGQKLELAVSWMPEASDVYTAEIFVWKSIEDPQPLSFETKRSTINV
jgi:hypothetical protein